MTSWRILVVDDEAGILRSVERVLAPEYSVVSMRSSRAAAGFAKEFKPDLAILDIQMPDMDGFQLMEELRGLDPEIDVIFMTGSVHELDAKLIRAIRKDAFYFLQKPFDREVLLTLVERCLELKRLDVSNREYMLRMEKELGAARAFQQSLLPPECGIVGEISVVARYAPCSELGGDFYDYLAVPPDGAVILVADVSGHGASAAMMTAIVKSAFHSASSEDYEPASVVERVANGIRTFAENHFVTLICTRIRDGLLDYVNAGHPPGIMSTLESSTAVLESTGPIISPVVNASREQIRIRVKRRSDRMVLFTDGVIEAGPESDAFGIDRLVQEISKRPSRGSVLSKQIMQSVRQYAAGQPISDDMTLVVADL